MSRRHRKHSDEFKARVALEAVKEIRTMSELSSAYGIHSAIVSKWKRRLIEEASEVFRRGGGTSGKSEETLTAPLYQEIGRLKMEIDWLQKKL